MKDNKKKSGNERKQTLRMMLVQSAIGASVGIVMAWLAIRNSTSDEMGELLMAFAGILVLLGLAILLQTIEHEAGHLVFGLLTGYRFLSFRVGSFMIQKGQNGMKLHRYSLAGTGGQCLMVPPDIVNGKMPYVWYNLGGALMNLLTAVISIGAAYLSRENNWLETFFILHGLCGIATAMLNGIPIHTKEIMTDITHCR